MPVILPHNAHGHLKGLYLLFTSFKGFWGLVSLGGTGRDPGFCSRLTWVHGILNIYIVPIQNSTLY